MIAIRTLDIATIICIVIVGVNIIMIIDLTISIVTATTRITTMNLMIPIIIGNLSSLV